MKKFNMLIGVVLMQAVCMGLFCSTILAVGTSTGVSHKSYQSNWAKGEQFVFFDNYTENTREHIFSGSTTTSGGTTTITDGMVNVAHLTGSKDFAAYFAPGGAGGSVTVRYFGAFGTETVVASEGTRTFALLESLVVNVINGTSSTFSTNKNMLLAAVSIEVTAGTVSATVGLNSSTPR